MLVYLKAPKAKMILLGLVGFIVLFRFISGSRVIPAGSAPFFLGIILAGLGLIYLAEAKRKKGKKL